jgi:hypothetical protein
VRFSLVTWQYIGTTTYFFLMPVHVSAIYESRLYLGPSIVNRKPRGKHTIFMMFQGPKAQMPQRMIGLREWFNIYVNEVGANDTPIIPCDKSYDAQ